MTALNVGSDLEPLAIERISRTTLALFAGASGDHNPVHIDFDAAVAAGRDDVFAHGMLSMAYLGRYVSALAGPSAVRRFEARFVAITPVLAEPTCRGTVASVVALDEASQLATIELSMSLADGTVTVRGSADVVVPINQKVSSRGKA